MSNHYFLTHSFENNVRTGNPLRREHFLAFCEDSLEVILNIKTLSRSQVPRKIILSQNARSPQSIPIITPHNNFPPLYAHKCQGTFYFHKIHAPLPRMFCPHFRTISVTTVCLCSPYNSPIFPPK